MNEKMKELIAIGASVAGHCQTCLQYHLGKAQEAGVEPGEIREAIDVGHMVEKGAMAAMNDFSKKVLGDPVKTSSPCCGGSKKESGS